MLQKFSKLMLLIMMLAFTTVSSASAEASSLWLTVTTPNGNEIMRVGDIYQITWQASPDIDSIYIGYKDCPSCLNWIATNIPNTGSYDWTVFVGNTTNTQFTIYILGYDTSVGSTSDVSDAAFTVLPAQLSAPILITPINGKIVPTVRPTFDWEDVSETTSYTLQVSDTADFSNLLLNIDLSDSSHTSSKFPREIWLYWRVQALGQLEPSDWSYGLFQLK